MTFAASWIRLRSDLWLIFMSRKPFPFNPLNKSGATDKNMEESGLHEKILGLSLFSKLDWGSYIVTIVITVSKKIGALIHTKKLLFSEVIFLSTNSVSDFALNT